MAKHADAPQQLSETDAGDRGADPEPKDVGPEPVEDPIAWLRRVALLGLTTITALGALVGWLGFRSHESHQAHQQRQLLVQVGRQGALNLTTIDWQHADADIQRILDSATGTFYADFSHRSTPFVDAVKKAQSKSVGTVTEAGLESQSGDKAQVLVAVSVSTSNLGVAEEEPRHWRMRITVQEGSDGPKVADVAFVP